MDVVNLYLTMLLSAHGYLFSFMNNKLNTFMTLDMSRKIGGCMYV